MSLLRILLANGEPVPGGGGGGGSNPDDPSLTTMRAVTEPLGKNINGLGPSPAGGLTVNTTNALSILEDALDVRMVFEGHDFDVNVKVAARKGTAGPWLPVTVGGVDAISVPQGTLRLTTDVVFDSVVTGEEIFFRVFRAEGALSGAGTAGPWYSGGDTRFADPFVVNGSFLAASAYPVMLKGLARPSVVSPLVFGDSIAAMSLWWRLASDMAGVTGANQGVPVHRFDSGRWLSEDIMEAITHVLVQFGVNDLNQGASMPTLWNERALGCYDHVLSVSPEVPIWQSTTTPIVSTSNDCATLEGQTLNSGTAAARQGWVAFLRDGAPCDPVTREARAIGAGGDTVRAGQAGHVLGGIVDIAAAVEQGGSSAPTGKWRVDLGPLGGDGVHPSDLGQQYMAPPVAEWMAALVA